MILCCGEALIDMLPRQTAEGENSFVPHCGGAVFNTAIALGRLGAPVSFVAGISTDFFGDQLRNALQESRVELDHLIVSDRPTTLAFVKLAGGHASYAFFDENSAGRMLTEADMPALDETVEALHFSCLSLVSEPCGSAFEALMGRGAADRVVMLDPNIRTSFITDKQKHLARMRRMIAMADIVKLSDEDLAWFGETSEHAEIAARWLAAGPKLVVITGGAAGATAYTRGHTVSVAARRVEVVDTVGAGDTFNAGLLAGLREAELLDKNAVASLDAHQVEAALKMAVAAAAVTVSRAGANPPWRVELGQHP